MIIPVIMAGGKGTRLWPLSRANTPKQFIQLSSEKTLYQQTLERVSGTSIYSPPIVITNVEQRLIAAQQALNIGIPIARIILEPIARNTTAAIAAVAHYVKNTLGGETILQILPSDHAINDLLAWEKACTSAKGLAAAGKVVTFGISPTEPATGYGYIELGEGISEDCFSMGSFLEKPNKDTAVELISRERYCWNAGIFMATADVFLTEINKHENEIFQTVANALAYATSDNTFLQLDHDHFSKSPSISFDYAVMERTAIACVVKASFPWSDLGSWDAVWSNGIRDEKDNVVFGRATLVDTTRSIIISNSSHIVVQGVSDTAVIATDDAIYVGDLTSAQSVGEIAKALAASPATVCLT